MSKGGAAKGELVLAIYELANCFRQGWGVEKDPKAAFQYYLTAANLGDADAQNEVGWCYNEGYGVKKSRVRIHPGSRGLFRAPRPCTRHAELTTHRKMRQSIIDLPKSKATRLLAIHGSSFLLLLPPIKPISSSPNPIMVTAGPAACGACICIAT